MVLVTLPGAIEGLPGTSVDLGILTTGSPHTHLLLLANTQNPTPGHHVISTVYEKIKGILGEVSGGGVKIWYLTPNVRT